MSATDAARPIARLSSAPWLPNANRIAAFEEAVEATEVVETGVVMRSRLTVDRFRDDVLLLVSEVIVDEFEEALVTLSVWVVEVPLMTVVTVVSGVLVAYGSILGREQWGGCDDQQAISATGLPTGASISGLTC